MQREKNNQPAAASITAEIADYKKELRTERRKLKAILRRTTCEAKAKPLQIRLSEINNELLNLRDDGSYWNPNPNEIMEMHQQQEELIMQKPLLD